jgi:Spy/CpxP family protein refolding chaperone
MLTKNILSLILFVTLASVASAQIKIKAVNPARNLGLPAVAKDLQLTDDQRVKIKALNTEFMSEIRTLQGEGLTDLEEMQSRINGVSNQIKTKIKEILTPGQQARMLELTLQIGSPNALFEDPYRAQLEITKEQATKAGVLDDDLTEEIGQIQLSSDTPEAKVNKRLEITNKYRAKFEALLDAKQTEILKRLKGKPISD